MTTETSMTPQKAARFVWSPRSRAQLAGVTYMILLWPPLASAWYPYYLIFGIGELILLLCLLVKGVDSERWHERARALESAYRRYTE